MITLTETAAKKILSLIKDDPKTSAWMFRVMVSGGGCSGFQYNFSLDDTCHQDDQVFTEHGVEVVVDEASSALLAGAHIDYVEELIGASFQIKNPNASSSCGCGNSFSISE